GGPRPMVCKQSADLATGLALHLRDDYTDVERVIDENSIGPIECIVASVDDYVKSADSELAF
ncbi:hypothetical protein, partial [Allohahella marinimesophila]|uniref:hypothetical protein n=1 Tax=Allohahella marinimesophila TaxID=1054972 RepID=UPI0031DFE2E6